MAVSRRVLLAVVCSAAVVPNLARAQVQAQAGAGATAPIVALNDALVEVMKAGDSTAFAKRYAILAPAIDSGFDLPHILMISVGSYWTSLPPTQQAKLQEVFRSFIIANYVSNFHSYAGEVVAVAPRHPRRRRAAGGDEHDDEALGRRAAHRLCDGPGRRARGQVQDILLDGTISRVAVQRSDFSSLLSQGNASSLIASLEQKVSTLSGGAINA